MRELTLVTSTHAIALASHDFSKGRNEATQHISIFVVDDNFLVNTEEAVTTFGALKVGEMVNIEIDLMARYAARLMETRG